MRLQNKRRIGAAMYNQQISIRPKTIHLLARIMKPFIEEGIIAQTEANSIIANLRSISEKGTPLKEVQPKLLTQQNVSEMLGIAFSNFRKLEAQGEFPFRRRLIHGSVRYLNLDVLEYMLAENSSSFIK